MVFGVSSDIERPCEIGLQVSGLTIDQRIHTSACAIVFVHSFVLVAGAKTRFKRFPSPTLRRDTSIWGHRQWL